MQALAWLMCMFMVLSAHAEIKPIPMPGDNKLVVFTYDKNDTFTIMTLPGHVTDIQLSADETVTALALGDNVQWSVAQAPGHVFVRPFRPNTSTSATLVTDARTYQLTLRSSPENGKWYQRVSWEYPGIVIFQNNAPKPKSLPSETINQDDIAVASKTKSPIDNLNFEYEIQGKASFLPERVFDNGKFTWMKLSAKNDEMPALFIRGEGDDKFELVNYTADDLLIKIQRIFRTAVLKLGNEEVVIHNKSRKPIKSGLFGWGG